MPSWIDKRCDESGRALRVLMMRGREKLYWLAMTMRKEV